MFGIRVCENTLAPSSLAAAPASFLRASLPALSAQISDNLVGALTSASLYQNEGYLPVECPSKPAQYLTQKYGDVILTNEGKPGWYVTEPKVGFGSLNAAVVVTVATLAGSTNVTIIANVAGDYRWLPVGMNVVIAGAGINGADLHARIMANDGTNLTLDKMAETSLGGANAANVTYQPLTLG